MDPFDTLGIAPSFDVDLTSVEQRYRDLARVLHPDRHVGGSPAERRMSLGKAVEVNEAWRLVRDPIRRAEALLKRHGMEVKEGKEPPADPAFLMEMMEQREALSEAKAKADRPGVERLAAEVRRREKDVLGRLSAGFGDVAASQRVPLAKLASWIGELRYYRRFLDEVSSIEDG
jgi:molecular chaperone HscB